MIQIKGYENYFIKENGDVLSTFGKSPKVLKSRPSGSKGQYDSVMLYKNKKGRSYYVHRLVAQHFLNESEGRDCVNHLDGNGHNNDVSNLEWVTYGENMKHAVDTGLCKTPIVLKVTKTMANAIKNRYAEIKSSRKVAKEFSVGKSTVLRILNKDTKCYKLENMEAVL